MKTQFYDLSIETLDDGTIRLEQRDFSINSVCSPLEAPALPPGDGCLPSVTGSGSTHPEQPDSDLFAERAGEKQDGDD